MVNEYIAIQLEHHFQAIARQSAAMIVPLLLECSHQVLLYTLTAYLFSRVETPMPRSASAGVKIQCVDHRRYDLMNCTPFHAKEISCRNNSWVVGAEVSEMASIADAFTLVVIHYLCPLYFPF